MASWPPSRLIPRGSRNRDAPRQRTALQFPAAMKLPSFFEEGRLTVGAALEGLVRAATARPASVHTALRYSFSAGGKRIRPILCLERAGIFAGDDARRFEAENRPYSLNTGEDAVTHRRMNGSR